MRLVRSAAIALALVGAGCTLPAFQFPYPRPEGPRYEDRGDVNIGRVVALEARDGYMVVDFPWGRMQLSMDARELAYFSGGEDVAFDRALRPIWTARPGA